jgi:hypothetical protein
VRKISFYTKFYLVLSLISLFISAALIYKLYLAPERLSSFQAVRQRLLIFNSNYNYVGLLPESFAIDKLQLDESQKAEIRRLMDEFELKYRYANLKDKESALYRSYQRDLKKLSVLVRFQLDEEQTFKLFDLE